MPTSSLLIQLRRLLKQLRTLPVGPYSVADRYRLRQLLTATIEALHDLYASPLRYSDYFRHQLVLHQMLLVGEAIRLAPAIDSALRVSGPSLATWQHAHHTLLGVLETTLATPPLPG